MLPRRNVAAALAVPLLLAFTVFRPPSTSGPVERDFEAYYAAGATVNAGADPYSRAIWTAEGRVPGVRAVRDEMLPFVGPAATLPLWSLLARLPYAGAVTVWTTLLICAAGLIAAAALYAARAARDPWLFVSATSVTFLSAPVIGALALGQAALVSAAGVAVAVVAYGARWAARAWGATLIAAMQPNLALPLVARMRSGWDLAVVAVAAGAFALLTFAAGGGGTGFVTYLQRLGAHADAERDIAIQHTPASIAYAFGLPAQLTPQFGTLVALVAAVATLGIIVRERLDATAATLVACALLPFAVPFFHEHDFVLELFAILVLALRARAHARALASIAAVLVLVDWFGLAQRQAAQGQILCLGLAVVLGIAGLSRFKLAARGADFAGLFTLGVLAAIAIPIARSAAAPTWPENLPAHYRADPAADISAVWADEQRAAGLTKREPVWGLLRALPLAGCVVLAVGVVVDARGGRRVQRPQNGASERASASIAISSARQPTSYDDFLTIT